MQHSDYVIVAQLEEITTDPEPDSERYDMTIAEALYAAKQLIVVFSTPAVGNALDDAEPETVRSFRATRAASGVITRYPMLRSSSSK